MPPESGAYPPVHSGVAWPSPPRCPRFFVVSLIAFVVVTLLAGVVMFASNAYEKHKFAQSKKIHVPNLQKVEQGQPANYLLIGSDSRQGTDRSSATAPSRPVSAPT